MSAYNNNCYSGNLQNHVNSSNSGNNNGTPFNRQNVTDYMNRGNTSSTTNHVDMAVQLTRPASKTAMLVRQRRTMLEQLSCFLCKGYLIDATTIDECMDSFCKSCIVLHLRSNSGCPKCGILIHHANPLDAIHSDKVLQDIVYKLVPGLYDDEMKRRRDYYKGLYGGLSSEDDEESSSNSSNDRGALFSGEQYGVILHPKPFYKPTDSIDISLEPQTRSNSSTIYLDTKRQSIFTCLTSTFQSQQRQQSIKTLFPAVDSQQFKIYLRCPAKLVVFQLKKFLVAKFNLFKDDTINLLYLNETLNEEYSLIDIAYIYDLRGAEHIRLFYVIERDLSRIDYQAEMQLRKSSSSRSTADSCTQPVKRVCIDPHPKFYDEQNNNSNGKNHNISSQYGKSRDKPKQTTSAGSTNTPILRSYNTSRQELVCSTTSRTAIVKKSDTHVKSISNDQSSEQMRLRQCSSKDTRSSRKLATESQWPLPKVVMSSSDVSKEILDKNMNTYSRQTKNDNSSNSTQVSSQGNLCQIVPCINRVSQSSTIINPSQGSLVTLASFSGPRNSHVMTMSTTSTAATISSSYKNILSAGSTLRSSTVDSKVDSKNEQLGMQSSQSNPQLAFSFVTERGITIVRRINSQPQLQPATTSVNSHRSSPVPAIMASNSQMQRIQSQQQNTHDHQQTDVRTINPSTRSGVTQTNSFGSESSSSRHLIKVKPVYKTFVDPTKIKSPNLKKSSYTARH